MRMLLRLGLFFLLLSCAEEASGQTGWSEDDFTVLERPAEQMMQQYLLDVLDVQFFARDSLLRTLDTKEEWSRRIRTIGDSIASWTGPFPGRTPLNARTTGRIEREGYVVENVLFESRPNFLVSASLYLPKGYEGPRPAVLNLVGHREEGRLAYYVQQRSIAQARKGFVALSIDCIGQGERRQEDYTRYGSIPGGEHKGVGLRAFLAGWHVFNIMAWDAIRSVDYLVSRPEVDPEQIAITGASGGGMMATYLLPLEPRISVAVPTDNPTTYSYHAHLPVGTDHEQAFFGAFGSGIDMRGDPLLTHLPKPLLVNASIDDHLNPPRGVWDLARWLEKAYATFGASDRFDVYMSDSPHGYRTVDQREAAYAWMLRWMGGDERQFAEGDIAIERAEDLWATPNGNVYRLSDSVQPHDLVTAFLDDHMPQWEPIETETDMEHRRAGVKRLIDQVLQVDLDVPVPPMDEGDHRVVDGQRIDQVVLRPEPGIVLPAVMIQPYLPAETVVWQHRDQEHGRWVESTQAVPQGPVVLYLTDHGKIGLLQRKSIVDTLVAQGYRILAVDLRGTGETAPGLESALLDFLVGRPIFGQRVRDVLSCVEWLSQRKRHADGIYLWAEGVAALHAAFAAALRDDIEGLVLEEPLISFESAVRAKTGPYREEILVPGVLKHVDMPCILKPAIRCGSSYCRAASP